MTTESFTLLESPSRVQELDRLGDEIAELSAHLDAATARLLDLIREFDARGGWNTGFRSCAEWLSWRVGLAPGAARERVRAPAARRRAGVFAGASDATADRGDGVRRVVAAGAHRRLALRRRRGGSRVVAHGSPSRYRCTGRSTSRYFQ